MSITTDSYYDIIKDGITLDRIGLSKTLNNYSMSEIADYAFVGSYSQCGKQISERSLPNYTYVGYSSTHGSCPFTASFTGGVYTKIEIDQGGTSFYNFTENGIYRKVVLVHDTSGNYPFNPQGSELNTLKIITEFDAPKYSVDLGTKTSMEFQSSGYWVPGEGGTTKYNTHIGHVDNQQISTCGFIPYIIIEYNSTYYIINANILGYYGYSPLFRAININNSNVSVCSNQIVDYQGSNAAGISESVSIFAQNSDFTDTLELPFTQNLENSNDYWNNYDGYASLIRFYNYGFDQYFCFTNEYNLLLYCAGCYGLHFIVDGTVYKPLISDNFVTGYTNDLTQASDLDGYTGSTKHTMPVTPPSPTPPTPPEDEDNYADMGIGTGGNVGGLTSYAIMSLNDLADLIADFNTGLQTGQSVVNNFVCCYKLGPLSSFLCTTGAHNIIMSAYSTTGSNFVSIRSDYAVISSQKNSVLLGSITVPRKTNTFYDFSPYTTYELFIPCCGWVPLPDIVAGREIKVYLVFDLASCVCKGIVRISGTTIAEISGVIGSSVPFYVNDSGLARASLVTGVTQTIGNIAIGAVGAGTGNIGLAVMGLSNAVQSAQQTSIAGNTNYTAVRGGNGDMSAYANGEYCTIKITHPVVDPVVNNSMFGHTVGYLCEEVGQLSNFHGFTVCSNPHVHINATSAERDEITQLLEQGVILPDGE